METVDVRVARLEEKLTNVATRVIELQVSQGQQTGMLVQLVAAENRRKGALAVVGKIAAYVGTSGALGALVAWIFHR